jgi:hypothetical protein
VLLPKSVKKSITKTTIPRSMTQGKNIFVDISKLSSESLSGSKFWLIILDDATYYTRSIFWKATLEQNQHILHFIQQMATRVILLHQFDVTIQGTM